MKKYISFILSVLMIFAFSACSSSAEKVITSSSSALNVSSDSVSEEKNETDTNKIAVVYFSATGNTKAVAEKIADTVNADIFEITPAEEYTKDDLNYNDDNCRANKEMNDENSRPQIANDLSEIESYDTVLIGHPIWWGTAPRIIETFLDSYDLSGKTIYTFCTSGGSGIDKSIEDLRTEYPDLNIVGGKRFSSASADKEIEELAKQIENN